jgi:uncharacterized membrane protein
MEPARKKTPLATLSINLAIGMSLMVAGVLLCALSYRTMSLDPFLHWNGKMGKAFGILGLSLAITGPRWLWMKVDRQLAVAIVLAAVSIAIVWGARPSADEVPEMIRALHARAYCFLVIGGVTVTWASVRLVRAIASAHASAVLAPARMVTPPRS